MERNFLTFIQQVAFEWDAVAKAPVTSGNLDYDSGVELDKIPSADKDVPKRVQREILKDNQFLW